MLRPVKMKLVLYIISLGNSKRLLSIIKNLYKFEANFLARIMLMWLLVTLTAQSALVVLVIINKQSNTIENA
jgi:hypothetical protein